MNCARLSPHPILTGSAYSFESQTTSCSNYRYRSGESQRTWPGRVLAGYPRRPQRRSTNHAIRALHVRGSDSGGSARASRRVLCFRERPAARLSEPCPWPPRPSKSFGGREARDSHHEPGPTTRYLCHRRFRGRQPGIYRTAISGITTKASTSNAACTSSPLPRPAPLASEVSMRFGLRGFSHLISTGCTSSTDALGYALRTLRYGHAKTIVAGGVDAPIAPLIVRGFQLMRIMSTRWNEAPERAPPVLSRIGTASSLPEGAWFFILETAENAEARGARIYGEICGCALRARHSTAFVSRNAEKSRHAPSNSHSKKHRSRRSKSNMR